MSRPQTQLRYRSQEQLDQLRELARAAGMSLNEYILRKIEGPKLDISKRKVS